MRINFNREVVILVGWNYTYDRVYLGRLWTPFMVRRKK
jgi:hypothetical protein